MNDRYEADIKIVPDNTDHPDLLQVVQDLLDLWPLSGYELEAYVWHAFIPAARRAVARAKKGGAA
jgi:hypothetical protein